MPYDDMRIPDEVWEAERAVINGSAHFTAFGRAIQESMGLRETMHWLWNKDDGQDMQARYFVRVAMSFVIILKSLGWTVEPPTGS